jgi:hypothetical protein
MTKLEYPVTAGSQRISSRQYILLLPKYRLTCTQEGGEIKGNRRKGIVKGISRR